MNGFEPIDPVRAASETFGEFIEELTKLSASTFGGIKVANTFHNWGSKLHFHQQDQRDTAAQFEHMRSLLMIALIGTFESFFEDYGVGVLSRKFELTEARTHFNQHTSRQCPRGSFKYEVFLDRLDRGGELPPRLLSTLRDSIDIRNVWAHNAGRADAQYIAKHSTFGLGLGDRVGVSLEQFISALQAFTLYAMIMVSRDLVALGHRPFSADMLAGNEFGDEYAALYPDA